MGNNFSLRQNHQAIHVNRLQLGATYIVSEAASRREEIVAFGADPERIILLSFAKNFFNDEDLEPYFEGLMLRLRWHRKPATS